jgi:hypothetical protein
MVVRSRTIIRPLTSRIALVARREAAYCDGSRMEYQKLPRVSTALSMVPVMMKLYSEEVGLLRAGNRSW